MIWSMMYRAHLPEPLTNIKQDTYAPLRASSDISYAYRAYATAKVNIPNNKTVAASFTFEYSIAPFIKQSADELIPFLEEKLNELAFGILPPTHKIYFTKPIALYSSGFFFEGIHKLPGFEGVDVFYSTVPPEDEGKPWWGRYYDPALKPLYNPPPEHAFAEDFRSYVYTRNPDDPRVCCPALIPSYLWDRLRFFIRFFDTVYIYKPTEYARRQYYRFVEDEFPAIMRVLQGLSWLEPVELPSDVIGTPITDTGVFVSISLGEAYYSAWREVGGESEYQPGSEIIPAPPYLPNALQSSTQKAHLDKGVWKYSPDSGYYPRPSQPTWWDVVDFSTQISGISLLHMQTYHNYPWDEEGEWARRVQEEGIQEKVFASYSTGYRDDQGNWIVPPFVNAVPPLLIVNSTSGDLILLDLDGEEVESETYTKVWVRGRYRRRGRLGSLAYKFHSILTAKAQVTFTSMKVLKEKAKGYAPPKPETMKKVLYPYFELVDCFSYPDGKFIPPEKRQLMFAPEDVNRFWNMHPPYRITTQGGREYIHQITLKSSSLPTGESSNVIAHIDAPDISINPMVDNLSVQLSETDTEDSVRPWLEQHLSPAFKYIVGVIRQGLLNRKYKHLRMIKDDVTIHQVKMLKGAPSGSFPITITSKKEMVSVEEYARKVGVPLELLDEKLRSAFRAVYRLRARIPYGTYSVLPDKVGSFSALFKQLERENKHIADFPLEESPKVVRFTGAAVSPPELQFIGRYLVLISPAIGLLWELRARFVTLAISNALIAWGYLISAFKKPDEWAALLSALTLQPITAADIAFLKFDWENWRFVFRSYTQPVIVSALLANGKTNTLVEYNISADSWNLSVSAGSSNTQSNSHTVNTTYDTTSTAKHVWSYVMNWLKMHDAPNNAAPTLVDDLAVSLAQSLPAPPPEWNINRERWSRMIVQQMFASPFSAIPPQVIPAQEGLWSAICGVRSVVKELRLDAAPPVFSQTQVTTPYTIVDVKGGGVIDYPIGGVHSARTQVAPKDDRLHVTKYQIMLNRIAKAEIFLLRQPSLQAENMVNIGGIVFLSRLSVSRFRSSIYAYLNRDNDLEYNSMEIDNYAYLLSSLATYAPFVFPDLPQGDAMHVYVPVDAWDVVTKPEYARQFNVVLAHGTYLPKPTKTVQYSHQLSEGWVFRITPSSVGDMIEGFVLPPHQREGAKMKGKKTQAIALPVGEFILQPLPLWLLRCEDIPPMGALFSKENQKERSFRLIVRRLPEFRAQVTPQGVVQDDEIYHEFKMRLIPDRMEVEKGDFDVPIWVDAPGKGRMRLYSPDKNDDEHWVELCCGAQGYFIPIYRYYKERNEVGTQPLKDNRARYPAERTHQMSLQAPEELWFDGVSEALDDNEDKTEEIVNLRLDPRHPYHRRVYMNIFLPHPILPKVYAVVKNNKVTFLHLAEEPMVMFGLLRWVAEYSPEKYLWDKAWKSNKRPEFLIKLWREILQHYKSDLPTLYWLEHSYKYVKAGLESLRELLTLGLDKNEYFASDDEKQLFNYLINYYTEDYRRLDYAPVASYYAPADLDDERLVHDWMNKREPILNPKKRTPACLLVMPSPHKVFEHSDVLVYFDKMSVYSSPAIFVVAPQFPIPRQISELDLVTAYTLLQEHAEMLQRRWDDLDYPRCVYYTMLSLSDLDYLRSFQPLSYGKHVTNIKYMLSMGILSPLFASAFVDPYYPSVFEVSRAIKDALALGVWQTARTNYWEFPDVRFRRYGIFAPLRRYPYPILLESMLAYIRAFSRTNTHADALRRLCRPTIDFRLSEYSVLPFAIPYIFMPSRDKRRWEQEIYGVKVYFPKLVIDDFREGLFRFYANELARPSELDYHLPVPSGGYLNIYTAPTPPTPTTAFASLMFLQPNFYSDWFVLKSPTTLSDTTMWGVKIAYSLGEQNLVEAHSFAAFDYASVPFVGGALPLTHVVIVGLLREQDTNKLPSLRKLVLHGWMPILYDGGLIWESTKNISIANIENALMQSERNIVHLVFPMLYTRKEMEEKKLIAPQQEGQQGNEKGGANWTARKRSWALKIPQKYNLVWLVHELPPFTVGAFHYPYSIQVIRAMRPDMQDKHASELLERLLRSCPQKEFKAFVNEHYYTGFHHNINYLLHVRSPLNCWLVGGYKLVNEVKPYIPEYPEIIESFRAAMHLYSYTDPYNIELARSYYIQYWFLLLHLLLKLM